MRYKLCFLFETISNNILFVVSTGAGKEATNLHRMRYNFFVDSSDLWFLIGFEDTSYFYIVCDRIFCQSSELLPVLLPSKRVSIIDTPYFVAQFVDDCRLSFFCRCPS